jgi:helicase
LLLSLSKDGKKLPLPFPQFYNNDDCKKYVNCSYQEGNYGNKLIRLVYAQGGENKKLFRDMLMLKKVKEDNEEAAITSENHLAFEKTLLLYDWIKGSREIKTKTTEQKYELYRGAIYRLGEGFSWLADSLAALAESEGWKKGREDDLNTIISLSKRLIEGVKEEGLNLIRLYVPGLNRYYIGKLLGDGYKDENCLKELSEEQLIKVLPKRLVNRIQKRFALVLSSSSTKNNKAKTGNLKIESGDRKLESENPKSESGDPKSETGCSSPTSVTSVNSRLAACSSKLTACSTDPHTLNTNQQQPTTILEIDTHRPDRIIFEGKEVKLTTIGFSLLYLLAQHREKVVSYEEILKDLWKGEKDAIYTRINYHICKIRKDISKIMDKKEDNTKKIENIFKTIPGRGLMLNIKEEELEIN